MQKSVKQVPKIILCDFPGEIGGSRIPRQEYGNNYKDVFHEK